MCPGLPGLLAGAAAGNPFLTSEVFRLSLLDTARVILVGNELLTGVSLVS